MFTSKLFRNAFASILIGILAISVIFYWITVPHVKRMTYEIEENSGQTILESVYQLIIQHKKNLDSWRESTLDGHKRELRNVVMLVESYLKQLRDDVNSGRITEKEARTRALQHIRQFKYGNNDYIWVADYNSTLISHPDPSLNNSDSSTLKDVKGNLIVAPMVAGARLKGEGYHTYWWKRLGAQTPSEKMTYYKHLQEWRWVIGTGVYIDDINLEQARRKEQLIAELRKHLRTTPIAKTGYIYIFDGSMNMVIHPNSNIENTNIRNLLDPLTKVPLAQELMAVSQQKDNKLLYKWDKPSDPGHYTYEKISWVRYFKDFDWYVASSVYTDDLRNNADELGRKILLMTMFILLISLVASFLLLRNIIRPIVQLAESAERISRGELGVVTDIRRDDEIGKLANAFNGMVHRLKDQIEHLEHRVEERTCELTGWVEKLEQRNQEIASISIMGDLLQACLASEETYEVVAKALKDIFPDDSGSLLMLNNSRNMLETVASWGDGKDGFQPFYDRDDCWALRRGKLHYVDNLAGGQVCRHISGESGSSICANLVAQGEILGVLHLRSNLPDNTDRLAEQQNRRRIIETISEHIAMALANLRLRESLRIQSTRDPLTGLFNRRYLEETLDREVHRAKRQKTSLGIIMIDVDHFKLINDEHGHEAGDVVLRELGSLLKRQVRGEDIVCRFGGEEFTVILPAAGLEGAHLRASALREAVEQHMRAHWRGIDLLVTISAGVASYPECGTEVSEALEAADAALYRAKRSGRNRVETAPQMNELPETESE